MDIYESINAEYAAIREKNEAAHRALIGKVHERLPRIKEIDAECLEICKSYGLMAIDDKITAEQAERLMKEKVGTLLDEKERLLNKIGLTTKALERPYDCPNCKDKGYADGRRCKCYYTRLTAALIGASNISPADAHDFSEFDLMLYSDRVIEKYGISPRDNAKSVLKTAREFAQGSPAAPKNLFLYGATGLGKTFTSGCIAKTYAQNRHPVFYISAPRLFAAFEDFKFGRGDSELTHSVSESVSRCDLLIIDDLGAEFHTPFIDSCLFDIINSRITGAKKTVISSNMTPRELSQHYSDRIASRILGDFEQLLFIGDDIRLKRLS